MLQKVEQTPKWEQRGRKKTIIYKALIISAIIDLCIISTFYKQKM
jgi:hypothetical protein